MRRLRSRRLARTLQLNRHFGQRLGWAQYAPQIARMLGSPSRVPWSLPFARAVARWQRHAGFSVIDGVISPQAWMMLRTGLAGGPPAAMPDQTTIPGDGMPHMEPMPPTSAPAQAAGPEPWAADPPGGMEPPSGEPDDMSGDAGGDMGGDLAGDDGGAGGDDAANEWGWLREWGVQ